MKPHAPQVGRGGGGKRKKKKKKKGKGRFPFRKCRGTERGKEKKGERKGGGRGERGGEKALAAFFRPLPAALGERGEEKKGKKRGEEKERPWLTDLLSRKLLTKIG